MGGINTKTSIFTISILSVLIIGLSSSQDVFAITEPLVPTGTSAFEDVTIVGENTISALTDLRNDTYVQMDANNEGVLFDFVDITQEGFSVEQIDFELWASTLESNKGAVKMNYAASNGTLFEYPDIFLNSFVDKRIDGLEIAKHTLTITTNPLTNEPFTLEELNSYTFGFLMQTNAKPSQVYQFNGTVTLKDNIPPVVTPPNDITIPASLVVGVHTPVDIKAGDARAIDGVDGNLTAFISNDAPLPNPLCDDFTNGGNVLNCFLTGVTIIEYSATDNAGNTGFGYQTITIETPEISAGWTSESGGVFIVNTDPIETQIGSDEIIQVTSYLGNNNAGDFDTITVNFAETGSSGIDVTLQEVERNSGVFTHSPSVKFTAGPSSDQTEIPPLNHLHVETGQTITASYEEVSIATTIIDELAPPAGAGPTDVFTSDAGIYIIEETASVQVYDEWYLDNEDYRDALITGGKMRMKLTGDTSEVGLKLRHVGVSGVLVTEPSPGFSSGPTNIGAKVLHVDPTSTIPEEVSFTYNNNHGDGTTTTYPDLKVLVALPSLDDVTLSDIGADFGLRLDCAAYGGDDDGDFICNNWENQNLHTGIEISYDVTDPNNDDAFLYNTKWVQSCDPDATYDTDPSGATVCPSDQFKDIYVEIDYMTYNEPLTSAIHDVVAAFAASPVPNPGGDGIGFDEAGYGIQLHVIVDNEIPQVTMLPFNTIDPNGIPNDGDETLGFHDTKNVWFGTDDEIGRMPNGNLDGTVCSGCAGSPEEVLTLKRQAYHWGLFAQEQKDNPGSSGFGEVKGNDFLVSLGSFAGGTGDRDEQAATFMHEIGHNLGLHHGGHATATFNCKPHLFSVMNYAYQFEDWVGDRPLDYSRQTNSLIYTTALSEEDGYPATYWPDQFDNNGQLLKIVYGVGGVPTSSYTGPLIDWNGVDGISLNPITVNAPIANIPDIAGCDNGYSGPIASKSQWPELVYDFRSGSVFASGASQVPQSNYNLGIKGQDEPGKDFYEGITASNLVELETLVDDMMEGTIETSCTDTDLEYLDGELQAIRDILTTGEDPRNKQIKDATIALEALKETDEFQCLGQDGLDALNSSQNRLLEANTAAPRMEIRDADIDLKSKGVVEITIFGSPGFDVKLINATSVLLGGFENEDAPITHEFSQDSVKNSHFKDDDGDGFTDLFLHFTQSTIKSLETGDAVEVCTAGSTIETPAQLFRTCDNELILVKSGNKGGPNK
jgi:hypothetical protein